VLVSESEPMTLMTVKFRVLAYKEEFNREKQRLMRTKGFEDVK